MTNLNAGLKNCQASTSNGSNCRRASSHQYGSGHYCKQHYDIQKRHESGVRAQARAQARAETMAAKKPPEPSDNATTEEIGRRSRNDLIWALAVVRLNGIDKIEWNLLVDKLRRVIRSLETITVAKNGYVHEEDQYQDHEDEEEIPGNMKLGDQMEMEEKEDQDEKHVTDLAELRAGLDRAAPSPDADSWPLELGD
ncbi:hypothetical protein AOQ84DRAFT_378570 [Glonium stellatum]|uniref:Uncharacterized protein n=1 Tax=Glonium stellatum TaxID=574774 RepID=A0A8E2JR44_9PEZI|nr:hypothetical protein AOQ84DRAFT_378570 [Glonium stellatum]